jgi:hypothetical protein
VKLWFTGISSDIKHIDTVTAKRRNDQLVSFETWAPMAAAARVPTKVMKLISDGSSIASADDLYERLNLYFIWLGFR